MALLKWLRALRARVHVSVLETCLFLAIAVAIDWLFLDGTRYRGFTHHPFWIIVLLTTVQYGTNAGLLATVASTVTLLAGNVPPQPVSGDMYSWLADITRLPLLWFLVSVTMGELRVRQIGEANKLRENLEASANREKHLTDAYQRLNALRQTLEARVAGQLKTAVGIHEAARRIEKLDPEEVLMGVSGLLRAVINPKQFSLFILNGSRLEARLQEGWGEDSHYPVWYGPESELFREIVGHRHFLCRTSRADEILLRDDGMLAGPLLTASGQVYGMLKIENLGFLDLNFSNVQTFRAACEWIGTAYGNAVRYQQAKSDAIVSGESELLSYGFLARQTQLFTSLAKRIGFSVSMLVLEVANYNELPENDRGTIASRVSRCVGRALRTTDLAFDYKRTGAEFAVILPGTAADQVTVALQKLNAALSEEFHNEAAPPAFVHRIQVLHDHQGAKLAGAAR